MKYIVKALWIGCYALVAILFVLLCVATYRRVIFPWDMYLWPESPLLTDLMKLRLHLPVYSNPADGNSFVYSPGLEYLCYALLSPAGLELNVLWIRLVSITCAAIAACFAALAILKAGKPKSTLLICYLPMCWAVVILALGKNYMFEIGHPDNLHALHGLLLFWLCLLAVDTRKFWVAVVTMIVGGVGLYAKQTEAVAWVGPALVFLWLRPWGWKRSIILAAIGALTCALALALLWGRPYAKLFTWTLLTHQEIIPGKIWLVLHEILVIHNGLLQLVTIAGAICFAWGNQRTRQYFLCWLCVGFFVVVPSISAVLKVEGYFNNLTFFRVWMFLMALPFMASLVDSLGAAESPYPFHLLNPKLVRLGICLIAIGSCVWLLPHRTPPKPDFVQYCQAIDDSVNRDVKAQRKILIGHGTEFLIHAGSEAVPLDRANTILEMNLGKIGESSAMKERLRQQYYDRIYLLASKWYGPEMLAVINENYREESTIKGAEYKYTYTSGYTAELMEDCHVLVRRER